MPATIINVSAVEESTSRAKKYVAEQQDALNQIDRIVNNMQDAWDSEAQKAFADSFQRSKSEIEHFNQSMNESIDNMTSFVTECVKIDDSVARSIRNISW